MKRHDLSDTEWARLKALLPVAAGSGGDRQAGGWPYIQLATAGAAGRTQSKRAD
jgi:hypothetical protein